MRYQKTHNFHSKFVDMDSHECPKKVKKKEKHAKSEKLHMPVPQPRGDYTVLLKGGYNRILSKRFGSDQ
jgi:hypothetical protein